MDKSKIINRCAIVVGVVVFATWANRVVMSMASMAFTLHASVVEILSVSVMLVVLSVLGVVAGFVAWFVIAYGTAWLLMSKDEYKTFKRRFFHK